MTTEQEDRYHVAPLAQLVKQVLHKGATLEERVRKLRYRRRKPKQVASEEVQL